MDTIAPSRLLLQASGLICLGSVARALLTHVVFTPCGHWWMRKAGHERTPAKKVQRFCEAAWKVTAYASLLSIGCLALHDQPWLTDTRQFWKGWPDHVIPWKVKVYYAAEMGFYGEALLSLLLWEDRRTDFRVMLLHHLVTLALIGFSALWGYMRVGSVVMLLHDPSDIFLESAKLFKYIGAESASIAGFVGLLLSWFVCRLVLLPLWVIRSTGWEIVRELGHMPLGAGLLNVLLCSLVVMHLYWFGLMLQIAVQQLGSGSVSDIREDDDHDD